MENTSERGTLRELRRGLCAYTAILVGPMSWRHFAIASVSARTKLFKGPLEAEREGKGGRGDAVSDITHLVILVTSRSKKNFPAVNIFMCNNYYQDLFVREKYYLFIKERAYNMVAVNSLGLSIDVTHALINYYAHRICASGSQSRSQCESQWVLHVCIICTLPWCCL